MSNKDFEKKVINALSSIQSDVSELKTKVETLDKNVKTLDKKVENLDKKVERLDDKIDDQTLELKQTIRLQGSYIDQAFDRINYINSRQENYFSTSR